MTKENGKIRNVLLVPDIPGWAFDHHARDMMAMPSERIHLDLKYLNEVKKEDGRTYDLIYPMAVIMAVPLSNKGIPLNKMAAGISSERQFRFYQNPDNTFKGNFESIFKGLRAVNTASDEFVARFSRYRPVRKTRIGVDVGLFKPLYNRRENRVFTVGWVGSSKDNELKGFNIVEGALKGLDVNLQIRTRKDHFVPRKEMVKFYQGLDCFLCSSRSEHIPLPVLEAAACGVPVISTKVGIVPELIRSKVNGMIIDRSPEAFREAVQFLMKNPDQRKRMAKKARDTVVQNWSWEVCWKEWEDFFSTV